MVLFGLLLILALLTSDFVYSSLINFVFCWRYARLYFLKCFGALFAIFCNDNLYSPRDCFIICTLFYNLRFILSSFE
jgi:hypothetical protein